MKKRELHPHSNSVLRPKPKMEQPLNPGQPDPSKGGLTPETTEAVLAEYKALRDEILQKIEFLKQIYTLVLLALGPTLVLGLQYQNIILVMLYPVLALLLSITWSGTNRRLKEIGYYIKTQIEERFEEDTMSWEHFVSEVRHESKWFDFDERCAVTGLLIGTEALAILLGIFAIKHDTQIPFDVLLSVAGVSSVLTLCVLLRHPHCEERVKIHVRKNATHRSGTDGKGEMASIRRGEASLICIQSRARSRLRARSLTGRSSTRTVAASRTMQPERGENRANPASEEQRNENTHQGELQAQK